MEDSKVSVVLANGEVLNVIFMDNEEQPANEGIIKVYGFPVDDEGNIGIPDDILEGLGHLESAMTELEKKTGEEFSRSIQISLSGKSDAKVVDRDAVNSDFVLESDRDFYHDVYGDKNMISVTLDILKCPKEEINVVVSHEFHHAIENDYKIGGRLSNPASKLAAAGEFFVQSLELNDRIEFLMEIASVSDEAAVNNFVDLANDMKVDAIYLYQFLEDYKVNGESFDQSNLNHIQYILEDKEFLELNDKLIGSSDEFISKLGNHWSNNKEFLQKLNGDTPFFFGGAAVALVLNDEMFSRLYDNISRLHELEADAAVDKHHDALVTFLSGRSHTEECIGTHPDFDFRKFNIKIDKIMELDSPGGKSITKDELLTEFGPVEGLFKGFSGDITCSEVENGDVAIRYANSCQNITYNVSPEDKTVKDLLLGK